MGICRKSSCGSGGGRLWFCRTMGLRCLKETILIIFRPGRCHSGSPAGRPGWWFSCRCLRSGRERRRKFSAVLYTASSRRKSRHSLHPYISHIVKHTIEPSHTHEGAVLIFSITSALGLTSQTAPHFPHFLASSSASNSCTAFLICVPKSVQWKLS
jgi:hypothetical protein